MEHIGIIDLNVGEHEIRPYAWIIDVGIIAIIAGGMTPPLHAMITMWIRMHHDVL